MPTFWYPDTCSEDQGCVLQVSDDMQTLIGIAKTCTGHAQRQWGRTIALDVQNPHAAGAGDQGRYNAILAQNRRAEREPPGQAARRNA
jgi:hypothetical protein